MQAEVGTLHPFPFLGRDQYKGEERNVAQISEHHLSKNGIVGFAKLGATAQPFIRMRSKLVNLAKDTGQQIFAITSVQAGEGKTHVAINLAAALSRIAPTVLIELDLRRPSIALRLGINSLHKGVDDFLAGDASWDEGALKISGYNLDIHCVRTPHDNVEELLTSDNLGRLFEKVRGNKERPICIVDTSPITVEDDFMLIAPAIDGTLLVVEEGRTPKRALLQALDTMKPAPIVGSILNKSMWPKATVDYYGYYSA